MTGPRGAMFIPMPGIVLRLQSKPVWLPTASLVLQHQNLNRVLPWDLDLIAQL
jgi:hypothetical protein